MKRWRLCKRQRIFCTGAAKSPGSRCGSGSAKAKIVGMVGKDISRVRADSVDRDDDTLRDINRVRGEDSCWTVKSNVRKEINRPAAAARVKFDQGVGIDLVAGADVERAIRPERADFYNVAVKRGGADIYSTGQSRGLNIDRALIGLNLSADSDCAVAGGGQHCNLTWIPGRIEQGEKLRAAIDVNTAE